MIRQILQWRTLLALVAISIVTGTIFYSRYLAHKIAGEEKQRVEQWIEAGKFIIKAGPDTDIGLATLILAENKTIPIIVTDEKDKVIEHINLDSSRAAGNPSYVQGKLNTYRSANNVIIWSDPQNPQVKNKYYYGNSRLLDEVRYYPIIQLVIVALFILITLISLRSSYRSVQDQGWAGMAKETAHSWEPLFHHWKDGWKCSVRNQRMKKLHTSSKKM